MDHMLTMYAPFWLCAMIGTMLSRASASRLLPQTAQSAHYKHVVNPRLSILVHPGSSNIHDLAKLHAPRRVRNQLFHSFILIDTDYSTRLFI